MMMMMYLFTLMYFIIDHGIHLVADSSLYMYQ